MFIRFLIVGAIGFGIDAAITLLLIQQTVTPWLARVPAIVLAMTFTWLANRYFTYRVDRARSTREAIRYGLVALSTAAMNYLIYVILVGLGLWPVAAVALATAIQAIVSFRMYRYFVFGNPR